MPLEICHWVEVVHECFNDDVDFEVYWGAICLARHLEHMKLHVVLHAIVLELLEQLWFVEISILLLEGDVVVIAEEVYHLLLLESHADDGIRGRDSSCIHIVVR